MREARTGIEKKAIPFFPTGKSSTKFLQDKYILTRSTLKTQLSIVLEGIAAKVLHFLYEFNQAKQKLGYSNYQKLENGLEQ